MVFIFKATVRVNRKGPKESYKTDPWVRRNDIYRKTQILEPSLVLRGDLIETFKIFNGFTNINTNNLFILSYDTRTRNHEHKIFIQHCNTNRRKFSFGHRIASIWNDLPSSFKCAKTINQFKNFLDSCQKLQSKFYGYDG